MRGIDVQLGGHGSAAGFTGPWPFLPIYNLGSFNIGERKLARVFGTDVARSDQAATAFTLLRALNIEFNVI